MKIANELYNYDFFNDKSFKIELIGVNFLDNINSTKIYYQPMFSNIKEDKIEFTKNIVKKLYKNNLNQSIINIIDCYSRSYIGFIIKKTRQK